MSRTVLKHSRLIALFLFGVLLFNYPLLALWSRPDELLGIPVLYLYIFGGWALFVALLACIVECNR